MACARTRGVRVHVAQANRVTRRVGGGRERRCGGRSHVAVKPDAPVKTTDQQIGQPVPVQVTQKGFAPLTGVDTLPLKLQRAERRRVTRAGQVFPVDQFSDPLADHYVEVAVAVQVTEGRGERPGRRREGGEPEVVLVHQFKSGRSAGGRDVAQQPQPTVQDVGAGILVVVADHEVGPAVAVLVEDGNVGGSPEIQHPVDEKVALYEVKLRCRVGAVVAVVPHHVGILPVEDDGRRGDEVFIAVVVHVEVEGGGKIRDGGDHPVRVPGRVLLGDPGLFGTPVIEGEDEKTEGDIAQHQVLQAVTVVVERQQRGAGVAGLAGVFVAGQVIEALAGSRSQVQRRRDAAFEEATPALLGQFVDEGIGAETTLDGLVGVHLHAATGDGEGEYIQITVPVDVFYGGVVDVGNEERTPAATERGVQLGQRVAEVDEVETEPAVGAAAATVNGDPVDGQRVGEDVRRAVLVKIFEDDPLLDLRGEELHEVRRFVVLVAAESPQREVLLTGFVEEIQVIATVAVQVGALGLRRVEAAEPGQGQVPSVRAHRRVGGRKLDGLGADAGANPKELRDAGKKDEKQGEQAHG